MIYEMFYELSLWRNIIFVLFLVNLCVFCDVNLGVKVVYFRDCLKYFDCLRLNGDYG